MRIVTIVFAADWRSQLTSGEQRQSDVSAKNCRNRQQRVGGHAQRSSVVTGDCCIETVVLAFHVRDEWFDICRRARDARLECGPSANILRKTAAA